MIAKSLRNWRKPTPSEFSLLRRLLSKPFEGNEQIRAQLEFAQVAEIDSQHSLRFSTSRDATAAKTLERVPVEARATDGDGVTINVLLHVVDGFVHELEIYKDDSSGILVQPNAEEFDVVVHRNDYRPF